jgi:hypothetical protein
VCTHVHHDDPRVPKLLYLLWEELLWLLLPQFLRLRQHRGAGACPSR